MASVRFIERRGAVLTPSALACLSGVPTVNISSGCKNPDLTTDRGHLTRVAAPPQAAPAGQGLLWGASAASDG
jgi:hypothetical protein